MDSVIQEKKKIDKKKLIIIFIVLILIVLLVILLFKLFWEKGSSSNDIVKNFGIVSYYNTGEYRVEGLDGEYFLTKDIHNDYIVIDKDNKEKLKFPKAKKVYFYNNYGYYIFNVDDMFYVYDKDLNNLFNNVDIVDVIKDFYDGKIYFYVLDGKKNLVYDEECNELLDTPMGINSIYNGKAYSWEYAYDLKTGDKLEKYLSCEYIGEKIFVLTSTKKNVSVYFPDGSVKEYDSYENHYGRYIFVKGDEKLVIDSNGNVVSEDKIDIIDLNYGYYMDKSDCDEGFKLKNKDGNVIYGECIFEYNTSNIDKGVYATQDNDKTYIRLLDGRVFDPSDYLSIANGYFLALNENGELRIFNNNGDAIDTELSKKASIIQYMGNGKYYVYFEDKYAITDDKFDNMNDIYQDIACFYGKSNLCFVKKDNYYGLYMDGEEIVSPRFLNYDLIDTERYVYFTNVVGSLVLEFGDGDKFLTKNDIVIEDENYGTDLDLKEVIKEYKLENIESIIYDNETLFRKYAYIAINNSKLNEFTKYVLDEFVILADNKDKLDEDWLLYNLRNLTIEKSKKLSTPGAGGEYYSTNNIYILEDTPRILYHEIIHFMDYNFNFYVNHSDIYNCNNKLYKGFEYNRLSDEERESCKEYAVSSTQFISEYGTEKQTAYYFNNSGITAYYYAGLVYETLNYIYGNAIMDDIYYSSDTDYKFFELLVLDTGFDYDKYKDFLYYIDVLRDFNSSDYSLAFVKCADYLVDLYKLKNPDKKWYEDKEFLYNVSMISGESYKDSRYDKEYSRYDEFQGIDKILEKQLGKEYAYFGVMSLNMYYKNGSYYYVKTSKISKNDYISGYLRVEYDYDNKKIKSYEFFKDVIS